MLLASVVLASWVISWSWSYFHIFLPTKLISVDNINDWRERAEVVSSFQYFRHHCLQHTSSYNYILEFWNLCPWVQWNPKVHDSVETGIKFFSWPLAFCVTLDHRMRHLISLCFHFSKYSEVNSPQKLQGNSGWQEWRSPAPVPAQSRLSCGLWPSCSGLRPVRVRTSLMLKTAQPPWASAPLQFFSWGKGFSLTLTWASHVSGAAATSYPLTTHPYEDSGCISSSPSCWCWECCWVPSKSPLLLAEPALVSQPLLAGQGLQPHHLSGISSHTSSVYIEKVVWQLMY